MRLGKIKEVKPAAPKKVRERKVRTRKARPEKTSIRRGWRFGWKSTVLPLSAIVATGAAGFFAWGLWFGPGEEPIEPLAVPVLSQLPADDLFLHLRFGMTVSEVEGVLGSSASSKEAATFMDNEANVGTWETDDGSIAVTFVNGEVVRMSR